MAKITDWEKIFESFINAAEFEARLLFLEDEIYSVHFLKEKVPSLEDEVYRKLKGVTEDEEYQTLKSAIELERDSLLNSALYDEAMNYTEVYQKESLENWTTRATETEKEYETILHLQEETEKIRLNDKVGYFSESMGNLFSFSGIEERSDKEIKLLPREKKNELLKLYDTKVNERTGEMRVEIVSEKKGEFDYDADAITEIVGQKLYEMMQKGAEGFYM